MINRIIDQNQTLLIDNREVDVYSRIVANLDNCIEFKFNVAFIVYGGVQILLDKLKELEDKNIKGKIITTNYMNATEVDAIKKLLNFKNIEIKIYDSNTTIVGLHAKTYIFKNEKTSKVIIGSSNITSKGLRINCEWNVEMEYDNNSSSFLQIEEEFQNLWNSSKEFDENLFNENTFEIIESNNKIINKNKIQEKALIALEKLRQENQNKAIVVAATGTGKTYLSAFDVKQFKANKLLFICHRWEILKEAIKAFKKIFNDKQIKEIDEKPVKDNTYIFSTVQTMSKKYLKFKQDEFDYIIVDEAHHCASDSYEFIFNYFKSKFLLGLTATPERFDGKDIYEKFANNVAVNIRLKEALNENLLCPFNYFGVRDLQKIDLSNVDITKVKTYEKKLMIKERVDFIVEKLRFYTNPYKNFKCLAFCASVDHAEYMSIQFNQLGIKSINLDGTDDPETRIKYIEKLKNGEIEVIFCRDIFNEGIDIPEINTILMLRPTESPTIFIQQLGRGLRKFENKEVVTVIDFIGNHKNIYNLAFSFGAESLYDKDAIKKFIKDDFKSFSKFAFFRIDKIAKEEIINKIDSINFDSVNWLKNSYLNFKKTINEQKNIINEHDNKTNVIPMWLDYSNVESSPDIIKFIKCSSDKSYYSFLKKVINEDIKDLSITEYSMLKTIESFLPLKRNYEYIILKEILDKGYFDIKNFNKEIFVNFSDKSFENAINNLFLKHLDIKEQKSYGRIVELHDSKISFIYEFKNFQNNNFIKRYINEIFLYGLQEYNSRIETKNINELVMWEKYTRNQVLMMFNYTKSYSSFREGFLKINNNYLLMVNLDKTEMSNDAHKYKDDFIDKFTFQWESQNTTSIHSETGLNIINHKERNIKLHLFVRKNKKEVNKALPYYYLGDVDVINYQGNNPIRFTLKLKKMVPNEVYESLK